MRIFTSKSLALHNGLPYELKVPNAETRKAIEEVDKGIYHKGYKDVEELFTDLEK